MNNPKFLKLIIQMKLININDEEIDLEVTLSMEHLLGKDCFLFVFHNKSYQNKIIQVEQRDKMR